jgi:hypothetical protein
MRPKCSEWPRDLVWRTKSEPNSVYAVLRCDFTKIFTTSRSSFNTVALVLARGDYLVFTDYSIVL